MATLWPAFGELRAATSEAKRSLLLTAAGVSFRRCPERTADPTNATDGLPSKMRKDSEASIAGAEPGDAESLQ